MCSHDLAQKEAEKFREVFGVGPLPEQGKLDMWPGYLGGFIRRHARNPLHVDEPCERLNEPVPTTAPPQSTPRHLAR